MAATEGLMFREGRAGMMTTVHRDRRPWLQDAHGDVEKAVVAAYGWPADPPKEEVLARMLALNPEREPA